MDEIEYKEKRAIKIKMIEVIRRFAEEEGFEMSPHQEAELAADLYREIFGGDGS